MGRAILITALVALALLQGSACANDLSPKELKEAQKLYKMKCAKCHRIYEPTDYSQPEWDNWMVSMGKKSKLKAAQQDLLVRYTELLRRPKNAPIERGGR